MGEFLAAVYDPLIAPLDSLGVRKWRRWVVSGASGIVLELGVGTGLNLAQYRNADSVIAIDPDGPSLEQARSRSDRQGMAAEFARAGAEELPFPDDTFDTVVGTLVFCTISEPGRALAEVKRVLKTGGTFRLVEHVRVNNTLVGGLQDWVTPTWKQVSGGCHLNRDTLHTVQSAGFRVRGVSPHVGGLFIGIDSVKT